MSICFLSLETSKIFNKLILNCLENNGFDGLSEALIVLFPYIDANDKITVSQLSKQVGYTRQAIHKSIKKLEEFGYITLVLENQKEKFIHFTPKGEKLMLIANEFILEIENNLEKLIGSKELANHIKNQMAIYKYLQEK
ncbi:MAG: MarR family winged helix-turn-helix transcriptional regulator [Arcobacteraceae bacterium]|nr:MarR family winged helix-turn-helix transcriptional regulator [Arcobacteraceae bacterium]